MSNEKPKPDAARIIAALLAKIQTRGDYTIEVKAGDGGTLLPDSFKLMERKRLA